MVSSINLQQGGPSDSSSDLSHHPHGYVKVGFAPPLRSFVQWSPLFQTFHINVLELMVASCLSRGSILEDDLSYGLIWATIELFCALGEED